MNKYQLLFLVCLYAGIAYGAYRERQANKTKQMKSYNWITWFQLVTTVIGFFVFLFGFLFLGAL